MQAPTRKQSQNQITAAMAPKCKNSPATREENILAISHVNSNSHYTYHQNPSTVISYQHRLVAPPTPHTETASISYIIIIFIVILFMNFPAAKDIRNSYVYITA
jgi:hypothetical protein